MKNITRRGFTNTMLLVGAAAVLGACDKTKSDQTDDVFAGLETVAEANDAGFDAVEQDFFTEGDIAEIVKALKSDQARDGKLEKIAKAHNQFALITGYHTDSETLQITCPLPVYEYKDGAFNPSYPYYGDGAEDSYTLIFDGDEIVYLVESLNSEYGESLKQQFGLEFMPFNWVHDTNGEYVSPTEAYTQSTTKEAALILAEKGIYLYDGTGIWFVYTDGGYEGEYDPLNDDPISTPGLENLDRVSLLERQTFEYDSPELVIEANGQSKTIDTVADYEATLESML